MTIRDLSRYYYLKKQVESLKFQINELNASILSSPKMEETLSSSNSVSNPTESIFYKKQKLEYKLNNKLIETLKELEIIEDYIETVDDERVKVIIRYRFIELRSWDEIGNILHFDRTTPYYILKNYLITRMAKEKMEEEKIRNGNR